MTDIRRKYKNIDVVTPLLYRFGRDNFQEAMKLPKVSVSDVDWGKFKYMVFDIPNHPGTYSERYRQLGKYLFASLFNFLLFLYFLMIMLTSL